MAEQKLQSIGVSKTSEYENWLKKASNISSDVLVTIPLKKEEYVVIKNLEGLEDTKKQERYPTWFPY